jgi:hypothetical protein
MVDLSDEKNLRIRQNAVVRNESGDLAGTEIQLISGFPSVEFGAVDSPLMARHLAGLVFPADQPVRRGRGQPQCPEPADGV